MSDRLNQVDAAVVGIRYRPPAAQAVASRLEMGEGVDLLPEPDNRYDPDAMAVYAGGEHIGYIAATDVAKLARPLRPLAAVVTRPRGELNSLRVGVSAATEPYAEVAFTGATSSFWQETPAEVFTI